MEREKEKLASFFFPSDIHGGGGGSGLMKKKVNISENYSLFPCQCGQMRGGKFDALRFN